ncbi:MAG TPA: hypothetical protein PK087_04810 [Bacilli bacterium]|nr:MAG: hypothetical protein BWY97_00497 [Tenericutes bacterium ADurb.BinA124]HOH18625.1 hypothetical protein [Bacilli bacterium]HPN61640.1 hypothetical protein [Bacilli bacterium]HPX84730.1 hypothetical protein [Bacilli bacterium]HQC74452.1 hypothetical protein [Bacilli bacterium]
MNEKKLTYIVLSVAAFAILLVILLSIPWGGDKAAIDKEYDSLNGRDHVFTTISFDSVMEKIAAGETFQVYIGSAALPTAEQFVYETNKLAKSLNVATIYYLRSDKLTEDQITKIKIESSMAISFPTLIYWENDGATSTAFNISSLKDFSGSYQSNWSILLSEYFNDCYK